MTCGVYPAAHALIHQRPAFDVLMIDIPVGLTDQTARECDTAARRFLGRRHACVFSAPLRGALAARSREEASEISLRLAGRKVSCQAWGIYAKVRDVDEALSRDSSVTRRVYEVHPEVSFHAWNGGELIAPKKSREGKLIRQELIRKYFGEHAFSDFRGRFRVGDVSDDDLADAFAALWTAERHTKGLARSLPEKPVVDARGLRMSIWF